MSITYDEIYGMNLDEYCKLQRSSIDELIMKTEVDIEILTFRLKEEFSIDIKSPKYNSPISDKIFQLLNKKKKHLTRLIEWRRNGVLL